MNIETFNRILGSASPLSATDRQTLLSGYNSAALEMGWDTVDRCAYGLAQLREESANFYYTQEAGSDSYLRGLRYYPWIGRTLIQMTWPDHYLACGVEAHKRGMVSYDRYFMDNPAALAQKRFAWLGPIVFWRDNNLNRFSDSHDFLGLTEAINGGTNGLAEREANLRAILPLGNALLPEEEEVGPAHWTQEDWDAFNSHMGNFATQIANRVTNGTRTSLSNLARLMAGTYSDKKNYFSKEKFAGLWNVLGGK